MMLQGFSYPDTSNSNSITLVQHLSTLSDDSVQNRIYSLDGIVVTATRSPISQSLAPSRVSVIPKLSLEEHGGNGFGDLLIGQPGIFVRSYGGGLGVQVASFRGMGSEHTQVLLDGISITNIQNGVTDLRLISLDGLDRLELVRGGSSAVYGSDAVGGVMNLVSSRGSRVPDVNIGGSTGSFGSERYWMNAHLPVGTKGAIQLGSSTAYGSGGYPFAIQNGNSWQGAHRTNSDYRLMQTHAKGEWQPSDDTRLSLFLDQMSANQGAPGPVLIVAHQGGARQTDDGVRAGFLLEAGATGFLPWRLQGLFQNSYEHYEDASSNSPADNYYRNLTTTLVSSARYIIYPGLAFSGGAEFTHAVANGNALADEKTRSSFSLFGGSEIRWLSSSTQVSLYPLARYDGVSGIGGSLSPKLGLNVRHEIGHVGLLDQCSATLHATVGRDFRVPTLNQLYYVGAGGRGDPNLIPEHSTSFDAGLTLDCEFLGRHQFDVTCYLIATKDRLLWLPTASATIWSPVNVGKTASNGIELEWGWTSFDEILTLEANYSTIDSRKKFQSSPDDPTYNKQLIYVPLETASMSLTARVPLRNSVLSGFSFWCNDTFTGARFAVEDNSVSLPGYHLVRAQAVVELGLLGAVVKMQYEVDNVLNQAFEVVSRYPMPLRSHAVSISIHKQY